MKFDFKNPQCEACVTMIKWPFRHSEAFDYGWHDCGYNRWELLRILNMVRTHRKYLISKGMKRAKKQLKFKFNG